jgi:sugar phosphate permease
MKIKGFRWWIVALICLGTIINYLARNSLAVLAPQLQTKLNFTTQQYSYIVGAFQIGYTVMQAVCGFVLDFLGLRLGFSLFGMAWSVFNILHALAGGWLGLAIFRGLLGLSEAAAIPCRHQGDFRVVSSKRALRGGRLFQCGHFARSFVGATVSDLDFFAARLANGFRCDWWSRFHLGCFVVGVLPFAEGPVVAR